MTDKTGKRKSNYDSGRSQIEFCSPKTDDTVQIVDQIKLFIKNQVDVQLQGQKNELAVLREEIIQIKSSQAFISQKYDDLKLGYNAQQKKKIKSKIKK